MNDWKMIRATSGAMQLYDLATDPSETTNVAGGNPSVVATLAAMMDANHETMRPQYNVAPPTVGNASKDGIVPFGIRPGVVANRNWSVSESGDARSLSGLVRNAAAAAVGMYLDDLEPHYELTLSVDRPGEASPELLVELLGASGFVYFTAGYETAEQAVGVTTDVTLDLALTQATPAEATLRGDLSSPLTVQISHAGGAGEGFVDGIHFAFGPALADLNFDGVVDELDWAIERDNMFVDLGGMPLEEAYRLGDLNGDSWNNEFDFGLFKGAFDAAHGAGAFDNMLARVPEPATWTLAVLGAALAVCLVPSARSRPRLPRRSDRARGVGGDRIRDGSRTT